MKGKKHLKRTSPKAAKKKRDQTTTYALGEILPPAADKPFNKPIRSPAWFPDGADWKNQTAQRLFQDEVVGIKKNDGGSLTFRPFGIDFPKVNNNNEYSKKWALGSKLRQSGEVLDPNDRPFTNLVRRIALRVRQYNASLYRFRRLHFYWDHLKVRKDGETMPEPNPDVDKLDKNGVEINPPDPINNFDEFRTRIGNAEGDWDTVAKQLNSLLESGTDVDGSDYGYQLKAADMVAVNGYIISMRVVALKRPTRGRVGTLEAGGSSSHVSISSPFSSSPSP